MTADTDAAASALQLFRQGRMAEALPMLENLLAAGNTPLPCILALADARDATGDTAGAARLLGALHDALPQPDFALALAATLQRAGDPAALDATLPGLRNAHPADQRLVALHAEHLLKRGDFAAGFDLLPARWSLSANAGTTHGLRCPEWDGTPFPGTLLVGTEQGLGEVVLWSSMLADLVRLGQKTLVACDARLLALFRRSFPAIEFADAAGTPLQEPGTNPANRRIESADLGRYFRRSPGSFPPAANGWLLADPARTAVLRDAYRNRFPGKRLVGLSWRSHRPLRNESKDIPLADLMKLLSQHQDIVWVSLQYGDVAADITLLRESGLPVQVDPDIDMTQDIDGSCALAGALDEVVSCSNTMAHLAGALGLPVQLYLPGPRYVLWYWGYAGETTPWYPTMRIHRGALPRLSVTLTGPFSSVHSSRAMSTQPIENANVRAIEPLITPRQLHNELPLSAKARETVDNGRETIKAILDRRDPRLFIVIGPCSIHDTKAAMEYAGKLKALAEEVKDTLYLVLRVYFEKPRTTVGWKGLINDPYMNDTFRIQDGLHISRRLLLDLAELGLPTATEALDPISPQYLQDLISWSAIGARTTESQTHREMSSGLSTPVGFKNGTDGGLEVATNALQSVAHPHSFLGINGDGQVSIVHTSGNKYAHVVLRGGNGKPNYDSVSVALAEQALAKAKVSGNIMVDASHANSNKDPGLQPLVMDNVANQIVEGNRSIVGMMVESHLKFGNQKIPKDLSQLEYGKSVTDGCIDWDMTEDAVRKMADKLRDVLPKRGKPD